MLRRAAAGLGVLALLLAGCAPDGAGAAAGTEAPVVQLPEQALVEPTDANNPRQGPKVAEVGRTYPYDLFTQCGIEFTTFGGSVWVTDPPLVEPLPRADEKGYTTYNGYTAGTMTLVDATAARFVADTRYIEATDLVVDFRATDEPMPTCR